MKKLLKSSIAKRVLSASLVVALVITMIHVIPRDNSMDVIHAAEPGNYSGAVVREVVDTLDDLKKYHTDSSASRGSAQHPFVVLEIVPYQEFAQFGYLIGGCEPVDIDLMCRMGDYGNIESLSSGYVFIGNAIFFDDESESKLEYKSSRPINYYQMIPGYYELVKEGEGTYRYTKPEPSVEPTDEPADEPIETEAPTPEPTAAPTPEPTAEPTPEPTAEPTPEPTAEPTPEPTAEPTPEPTAEPTDEPTAEPTDEPTAEPTDEPTTEPTPESASASSEYLTSESESYLNLTIETVSGSDNNVDGQEEDINNDGQEGDTDNIGQEENSTSTGNDSDTLNGNDTDLEEGIASIDGETLEEDETSAPVQVGETIKKENGGNLVWHTVNDFSLNHYQVGSLADYTGKYSGIFFNEDIENAISNSNLENIGDKLYTYRVCDDENPAIIVDNYSAYKSKDNFLKYSVLPGASDEKIANYSVVVKTITPDELNNSPEWIDYADLIYLFSKVEAGNNVYIDLWKKYHRVGKASTIENNYPSDNSGFVDNDLDWNTTKKLYNKVTADKDYAAIIIDNNLYNGFLEASYSKESISVNLLDWNLRKTGTMSEARKDYSINNIYKLCMMLVTVDTDVFKAVYMNEDEPLIQEVKPEGSKVTTGKFIKHDGAASLYWGPYTFLLIQPGVYFNSVYDYFKDSWDSYHWVNNPTEEKFKTWVNEHVFTYKGDSSIVQYFMQDQVATKHNNTVVFPDFYDSLSEEEKQAAAQVDDNGNPKNRTKTANAIRYILGSEKNSEDDKYYGYGMTLRVLDLEPSVGLNADGTPDWYLTSNYIHIIMPHFKGKVEITHQTTAEFIGKIEDLNSTYNLIFMGLDNSAYNTTDSLETKWNDSSMNGKIYFHTGDKMISSQYVFNGVGDRSVKWLQMTDAEKKIYNDLELRFPGNDISSLKKDELNDYLRAGYPIVAETALYERNTKYIAQDTYVLSLMQENSERANLLGTNSPTKNIEWAIKNSLKAPVTFISTPAQYDGRTENEGDTKVMNSNYLPIKNGEASLEFTFQVNAANPDDLYMYRLYVDQDRDSKFSEDEVIGGSQLVVAPVTNDSYGISSTWVGLAQWKFEVYQVKRVYAENGVDFHYEETGVRYSTTGSSAVKNASSDKKQINVLQIMPKAIDPKAPYAGALDLSKNELFTKYYKDDSLEDYKINMTTITWDTFESYFYTINEENKKVSRGFYFDYSKDVNEIPGNGGNPNSDVLDKLGGDLDSYNMIIFGFGDGFAGLNPSNTYGAIDYLRYYVASGKSILFTHDLTTLYGVKYHMVGDGWEIDVDPAGYTVNALMRDLMGMNRYKSTSTQLDAARNTSNPTLESIMMAAYQNQNASRYDTVSNAARHGYTYFSMKRLGWHLYKDDYGERGIMPYKNMINTPGKEPQPVTSSIQHGRITGFNNNNDQTTRVSLVNEGQITTYPYLIGDIYWTCKNCGYVQAKNRPENCKCGADKQSFVQSVDTGALTVAPTHAQWYALSPEDEDVTVWYALARDPENSGAEKYTDIYNGSTLTYAVSPNDAMNNYYIYSKGNIFYSGVGHSTINGDMEVKLFINTMIAAYNSAYQPPIVEVTNKEAVVEGALKYSIELLQSYDYGLDSEGKTIQIIEKLDESESNYAVNFRPMDTNLITTSFECQIKYDDGTYVDKIYVLDGPNGKRKMKNGQYVILEADSTHTFKGENGLENRQYYSIDYPKGNLTNPDRTNIYFIIRNDRVKNSNTTTLKMEIQPLFPLD